MADLHTLYAASNSLFSGRARSYFIKSGLPYQEITPNTLHYAEYVQPKAHMWMLPTVETTDGEVIRDGAAIIDHFESLAGYPASPVTPRQRVLNRLFDVIGCEGLLRPAMHYRWNFEENLELLRFHFRSLVPAGHRNAEFGDKNMDRMRQAGVGFGATPDNFELIEALYEELIDLLDQHFAEVPYLLGYKPGIADFGMIAPFYGHLGRDPAPLRLMQTKAIRLLRWTERMNRPDPDRGEFPGDETGFLPDDEVPETLKAVLRHLAIDFVPETLAAAECINEWIDAQADLSPGTPLQRGVGMASFEVRGQKFTAIAQPYRFYLLKRVQDEVAALSEDGQTSVEALLTECGMWPLISSKLQRNIGRADNFEVWE